MFLTGSFFLWKTYKQIVLEYHQSLWQNNCQTGSSASSVKDAICPTSPLVLKFPPAKALSIIMIYVSFPL